eukprot:TRINITY_DN47847_c0_g1_i1.p1 TRINITY_DN47847_c0_g1~~TRINITY_DN47847_c0_g1_i1.p1  ORF type:complete len:325 (+),score=33.29 TRINITY_DN47847_c0_g1_i1:157-1131(+)
MWFVFDGLGIATWLLLAFADWVVTRHVFFTWWLADSPRINWIPFTDVGLVLFTFYQLVVILSWYSHFASVTTDPGTVTERQAPQEIAEPKFCKLCLPKDDPDAKKPWKPPRAHHCKTCQRCIFRMDHHCPWINNCVGLSNQKLFILFLGYTALCAILTLLLLLSSAVFWLMSQKSWADASPPGSAALICSGLVTIECLAAVLFVSDFLQEQLESIQQNSTLVETYQRTRGVRTTFADHFRQIFGHAWWQWPLPYPTHPTANYCEEVVREDGELDGMYPGMYSADDNDSLGIAGEESEVMDMETEEHNRTRDSLRQRYGHGAVTS